MASRERIAELCEAESSFVNGEITLVQGAFVVSEREEIRFIHSNCQTSVCERADTYYQRKSGPYTPMVLELTMG